MQTSVSATSGFFTRYFQMACDVKPTSLSLQSQCLAQKPSRPRNGVEHETQTWQGAVQWPQHPVCPPDPTSFQNMNLAI